jgi:hypothetical protein
MMRPASSFHPGEPMISGELTGSSAAMALQGSASKADPKIPSFRKERRLQGSTKRSPCFLKERIVPSFAFSLESMRHGRKSAVLLPRAEKKNQGKK